MFVKYIRNEDKKLHCAFWCPFCVTESRQADDQEGKLFTHTGESESAGFYLVHRAFYVKIRCLRHNKLFFDMQYLHKNKPLNSLKGKVYMRLFHI